MVHDGFISDSKSADGRLPPALQNGVQRLARPWYRQRALDVFRDERLQYLGDAAATAPPACPAPSP